MTLRSQAALEKSVRCWNEDCMRLTFDIETVWFYIPHGVHVSKWLADDFNSLIIEVDDWKDTLIMATQQVGSVHAQAQVSKHIAIQWNRYIGSQEVLVVIGLDNGSHWWHWHHEAHENELISSFKGWQTSTACMNCLDRLSDYVRLILDTLLHLIDFYAGLHHVAFDEHVTVWE